MAQAMFALARSIRLRRLCLAGVPLAVGARACRVASCVSRGRLPWWSDPGALRRRAPAPPHRPCGLRGPADGAALVLALCASPRAGTIGGEILTALLAAAMGIRNAAVRSLGVPDLSTTVLTLTLTGLAADAGTRACCSRRRAGVRR